MMKTAGYSGTPLAKKLGLKQGFTVKLVNQPGNYFDRFSDLPSDLVVQDNADIAKDFIHFFTKNTAELDNGLKNLKKEIKQNGMIWVSWPKKSSKVETDITEGIIREKALQNGLVDIKVCAVDETWSGLKLVIPVKD